MFFKPNIFKYDFNQSKDCNNEDLIKFLSFDEFDITHLWKIYEKAYEIGGKFAYLESMQSDSDAKIASPSSQLYFNLKIPMLILFVKLVDCAEIRNNIQNAKQVSYQNIFDSLCEIIDSSTSDDQTTVSKSEAQTRTLLKKVAEKILNNGLLVFFPSEKERKECFLYMIEKNTISLDKKAASGNLTQLENCYMTKSDMSLKRPSTKLLFEAFCNLFCSNKSNLIQHLNKSSNMFDNWHDCQKMIYLFDKIMNLSLILNESSDDTPPSDNLTSSLNSLLISVQSHLFFTIKEQLCKVNRASSQIEVNIKKFVSEYTLLLIAKSSHVIKTTLATKDASTVDLKKFKKTYNVSLFYNFILWLIEIFNKLDLVTCTNLVDILVEFHTDIDNMIHYVFRNEKHGETEKVLKTWTFNSKVRSSMTDVSIDYNYPLANRFVVEFDANSNLLNSEPASE